MPHAVPTLRYVLAIALLHQAGAGACGCAEHNGWVQTGWAVATHLGCDHPSHAPAGDPAPGWDHNDCDVAPPLLACRANDRGAERFAAPHAAANGPDPVAVTIALATAASEPNARPPGLAVRAALQVFRL